MPSGVAWLTKKSRASGSASASQVRTLIPRARAFLSTDEIPSRVLDGNGDHVDAARDPRVDHFILLGRIGVGRSVPDQLDPQLASGFFGSLSAGDEVGVALALGHHGYGDRAAAGACYVGRYLGRRRRRQPGPAFRSYATRLSRLDQVRRCSRR